MTRRKFKFVEMFINPETNSPYDIGSPKIINTENFGSFLGHQIARIKYTEKEIETEEPIIGEDGKVKGTKKVKKTILIEEMGQVGGWIEKMENLSQEGECWVDNDGYVLQNGLVSGDVKLHSGEVAGNARVDEEAQISGKVGIGDFAYIHGEAIVMGNKRIAVGGRAEVLGKVLDDAVVLEDAYVGKDGEVSIKAKVFGNAIIHGKVKDKANVYGRAVVYGVVEKNSYVGGEAVVTHSGVVSDDATALAGVVSGKMKKESSMVHGQPFLGESGVLDQDATVGGNGVVEGTVSQGGEVTDNGYVMGNGNVRESSIEDNSSSDGSFILAKGNGGAQSYGSVVKGTILGGARIGEAGSVGLGSAAGGSNVNGALSAGTDDASTIAFGATSSVGMAEAATTVGDNGYATGGSQVHVNDDDTEPGEAAVVCEVEP